MKREKTTKLLQRGLVFRKAKKCMSLINITSETSASGGNEKTVWGKRGKWAAGEGAEMKTKKGGRAGTFLSF